MQSAFNIYTIDIFSPIHLVALAVAGILIALVFIFHRRVTPKVDKILRITSAIYMIAIELCYQICVVFHTGFNLTQIPFDLCAITLWCTIITMLIDKPKFFKIFFFWSITGALLSLMVCNIFDRWAFECFSYFSSHTMFLVAGIYYFLTRNIKFQFREFCLSCGTLIAVAGLVSIFNAILGTNFMYLVESPAEVAFLFDWAKPVNWLVYGFCIFIMNSVWYSLTMLWNKFYYQKNKSLPLALPFAEKQFIFSPWVSKRK